MLKGLLFQPRHFVGFSMIAALIGTALISPLYPIYQDQWGLSAGAISNIYVIYMSGALFGLVFLGRLGDRIGYAATLLVALLLALLGSVICMVAQEAVLLSIGRFMVGVAGTLATSSGVAGLNILAPEHKKPNVALKGSLLVAFGFGLGPVVGGIVGQWFGIPLISVHIPSLIMLVLGLAIMLKLEPRVKLADLRGKLSVGDFLPKLTWPKGPDAIVFGLACILPFITFGVFGLYASMAPTIIRNVLGLGGPMVSGLGIALILTGSCITQIIFKRMHFKKSALIGLGMLALSNALMVLNLYQGLAALFAVGLLFTAIGHGASMFAGAQVVNGISNNTNRASLTASYWAIGYCGSILPMIGTGLMADRWGLNTAVTVFCCSVVAMCLAGAVAFIVLATERRKAELETEAA